MARTKAIRMAALGSQPAALGQGIVRARGGMASCFAIRRPLILEIGSGKGESLVAMATVDRDHNHVGIDLKSARLWSGARLAVKHGLDNVLFVNAEARQLPELCAPGSVDAVWLPFPDPVARGSKAHKRLVSPHHLSVYEQVLRPGSRIHLKTDDDALFAYAISVVKRARCPVHACLGDLYASPPSGYPVHAESTYERRYRSLGRPIHYLCFELAAGSVHSEARPTPATQRQERLALAYGRPRSGLPREPIDDVTPSHPAR